MNRQEMAFFIIRPDKNAKHGRKHRAFYNPNALKNPLKYMVHAHYQEIIF